MASSSQPGFLARLRFQLKSSPGKTVTLSVLLLLLLGVVGFQLVGWLSPSSAAGAALAIGSQTADKSTRRTNVWLPGDEEAYNASLFNEAMSSDNASALRDVIAIPKRPPTPDVSPVVVRNIFAAPWQAETIMNQQTEGNHPRLSDDTHQAARKWVLQATLSTGSPGDAWAIIDGRKVGVGDRVEQFTVVAITPRSVTLGAGPLRRTLTME